jgi:hypothetical protein
MKCVSGYCKNALDLGTGLVSVGIPALLLIIASKVGNDKKKSAKYIRKVIFVGAAIGISFGVGGWLAFLYFLGVSIVLFAFLAKIASPIFSICKLSMGDTYLMVKYSFCLWNAKVIIPFEKIVYIRKEFRKSEQFCCGICGSYVTFIIGLDSLGVLNKQCILRISKSRANEAFRVLRERAFKTESVHMMDLD